MGPAEMASVSLIWLVLLGGGMLPLGGAPLPLDPALSAIAPPECIWYASFSGHGPADPQSKNQTEQLLAEPQVQRFFAEIESQVMKAVDRASAQGPEQQVLAKQVPILARTVLSRPVAIYVESVEISGERADVEAAFVLNAGDQRAATEAAIEELFKLDPEKLAKLQPDTVAGVEWRRLPEQPKAPTIRFGWKENYFIIAVGEKTATTVVERMKGTPPQWLTDLRKEHPVPREISLGYLNVAEILELVRPFVQAKDPKAWPAIGALGLTSVTAAHGVTGYDAEAIVSEAHLVTEGRPGLLGLLPYKPLAEDDLQVIPKESLLAFAFRINASEAWERYVEIARNMQPGVDEEIQRDMARIEQQIGVDIRRDLIDALDEAWVAYLPSGDLMTSWMSAAAAVRVKDSARLSEGVAKIVRAVKAELDRGPAEAAISESKFGEHTLYSVQFTRQPVPVSPSWCVGDKWLVVGLSPQSVRAALERKAEDSLAADEAIRQTLEREGAAALSYQNTPQFVRSAYPWLQMGIQMGSAQLRQQGIEFDASLMPSSEVIVKHLRPGIATLYFADDGFHYQSHHSVPGAGNLAAMAPVGAALLLPAITSARAAAFQARDMNNLKMISLGMLNYHDTRGEFPTNVYSEDGKPLLSWRVRLLPYMEQQALFDQFHLDEPWDSEHNRKLLEQMPELFASDGDPNPGKTRLQAMAGPDTIFPGDEKLRIQDVTDGTSQTMTFVQVSPERSVEWTKPDDLEFDEEDPFAGLDSAGGFIAAFCDGSVRRLSTSIDPEAMKAVVTRAGGEVVEHEALHSPR